MILINDRHIGIINPEIIYKTLKVRSKKLCEIMDNENATQQRRDWAYDEYIGYQEELQNLNEFNKMPFDTLIIIERDFEEEKKK